MRTVNPMTVMHNLLIANTFLIIAARQKRGSDYEESADLQQLAHYGFKQGQTDGTTNGAKPKETAPKGPDPPLKFGCLVARLKVTSAKNNKKRGLKSQDTPPRIEYREIRLKVISPENKKKGLD